jgi:hypothetical protein
MYSLNIRGLSGTLCSTVGSGLLILLILPLFFSSCTKEVIVTQEVEKVNDWTRLEIFNEPYYSFKNFSDHLLIQTPSGYLNIGTDLNDSQCIKTSFGTDSYREPITEQWIINQAWCFLNGHPSAYSSCDLTSQETTIGDLREGLGKFHFGGVIGSQRKKITDFLKKKG